MADFRRWFVVLAMIALFTGVAAAQQCSAVTQNTPTLRSEGVTELVGEIVITCNGGQVVPPGSTPLPQANVIVTLTAPVTSRLAGNATNNPLKISEALLLIDEPTAPVTPVIPGFGPAAPILVCTSVTGGCLEYPSTVPAAGLPGGQAVVATNTVGGTTPGYNAFQGLVSGTNQIVFPGIPILPPATSAVSRVYRITNIRVNANGAAGSLIAGVGSLVQAYLTTSGPASLPVGNQLLTVGFAQTSLVASASAAKTFTQCNAQTQALVGLVTFKENFQSAFKTRVAPLVDTSTASYVATNGGANQQNVPQTVYMNSESGFVLPVTAPISMVAGLADFGTRLKATFTNLPKGITLYVTAANVSDSGAAIAVPTGGAGSKAQTSYALYTGAGDSAAYKDPTVAGGLVNIGTTSTVNGTLSATWEVVNSQLAASETFNFGVYISYAPAGISPDNTPTLTGTTNLPSVALTYAPISAAGDAQPSTSPIPRFVSAAAGSQFLNIVPCQTILLFPYVTTAEGLNTGLAISNTGLDPLGAAAVVGPPAVPSTLTVSSQGSCKLYFYGSDSLTHAQLLPASPVPTIGPIAPGNPDDRAGAFLASDKWGLNRTGYMFAVCDFQYAHGFAFISDVNLRNLAMGYLALVVNNGTQVTRAATLSGESLNN